MTPDDSLHLLKNWKLKINGLKFDRTEVSSVTTAWGVDWTEEMVARDLLQNFFDANRARVSEIRVTLVHVIRRAKPASESADGSDQSQPA